MRLDCYYTEWSNATYYLLDFFVSSINSRTNFGKLIIEMLYYLMALPLYCFSVHLFVCLIL